MLKILKRLLRLGIVKEIQLKNKIVTFKKKKIIFIDYSVSKKSASTKKISIDRGSRPLKSGITLLTDDIYYGDYWSNPNRNPAFIYRIDTQTGKKEAFYEFKSIRHVHFVNKDRYVENSLLVGTGDLDHECGIYRIYIDSKEEETIGEGSQKFRAVSIVQTKDYLVWGSDDPDGINYIYRYRKKDGLLEELKEIDGPAYYSTMDKKGRMYIATTVEDRRRHRAVIYCSEDVGDTWKEYREFKKDMWHTKYFGHGIVEFSDDQEEKEELEYTLLGLKEKK